ncbi:DUF2332 domain-containing protein [Promineifilum sp.]|uniref:DUF2332 domain-containing protein n=1 Tax=Promineifilum sp. TaxID=2664178 RepID=UPI0035B4C658
MTQPDRPRQLDRLPHGFREQERFAAGYSPLYAQLFGVVAGWLEKGEADPVAAWLRDVSAGRRPVEVTLLLAAALHREVLAGAPEVAALARFYPTVGGHTPGAANGAFAAALREAILARRAALTPFIQQATVQTNETARGLVWLLPIAHLGWPAVHLVELGASAGLNLVAERRAYRLVDEAEPSRTLLELGAMGESPFVTAVRGEWTGATHFLKWVAPQVLSRTGGDLHPFHLNTEEDERTLAAFVWGDQPARLARLRQGIAALHAVEATTAPVRLFPLRLPDELPDFLVRHAPPADAPVVIYNTVVTMYLPERGAALREMVGRWAEGHAAPVLWLQWELSPEGEHPPEKDWLAWTADLWQDGRHRQRRLGWIHPHGGALEWLRIDI